MLKTYEKKLQVGLQHTLYLHSSNFKSPKKCPIFYVSPIVTHLFAIFISNGIEIDWKLTSSEKNVRTHKINIFIWCSILTDICGRYCSFFLLVIFGLSPQHRSLCSHNFHYYNFIHSVTMFRANIQVTLFFPNQLFSLQHFVFSLRNFFIVFVVILYIFFSLCHFSCTSASDDWTCPFCDWMKCSCFHWNVLVLVLTIVKTKPKQQRKNWTLLYVVHKHNRHTYSCMHWGVSCKEHLNIQKHRWETIFDHRNRYYIDLYVQILTFEQSSKMEKSVQTCIARFTTKVRT